MNKFDNVASSKKGLVCDMAIKHVLVCKKYCHKNQETNQWRIQDSQNRGAKPGRGRVAITVADPGFPPRRGRQLSGGAPTYELAKFPPKLHEIERIWTRGGNLCSSGSGGGRGWLSSKIFTM